MGAMRNNPPSPSMTTQHELIRDQFTRQAMPFSCAPAIRNEEALKLLLALTGASSNDTVLDVACGPGIVACAFAEVVAQATGLRLPAALRRRDERGYAAGRWADMDLIPDCRTDGGKPPG